MNEADSLSTKSLALIGNARLKAAVVEVLEERRDLVRDALADAVEDIGLVRAIEAGSRSKAATRAEVFKILRKNR